MAPQQMVSLVLLAICFVLLTLLILEREKVREAVSLRDIAIANADRQVEQTLAEANERIARTTEQYRAEANQEIEKFKAEAQEKVAAATVAAAEARDKARDDALIFASVITERVREDEGAHVIVPLSVMLSELERDFGRSTPGKALAEAKKQRRNLLRQNQAATCSDANERHRAIAEEFVRSVFDEKVDAIFKAVSASDYTKGSKDIRDVRDALNATARALFGASITREYADARLKELKALIVVLGYRERAREEQRAIREQMRDEEKAQREAARVLRESVKRKADDERKEAELEARMELAKGAEREKYEAILADFRAKMKEQEDRELRARSLAEFTKRGHVYVVSNIGSFGDDVLKVGMTRRLFPEERIAELGNASVPFPFDIHAMIECEDAPAVEAEFHREFNDRRLNKVNSRKEFFRVNLEEIHGFLAQQKIDPARAKFTMLAEARQFRESQAIEALPEKAREKALSDILAEDEKDLVEGFEEDNDDNDDETDDNR